MKRLNQSVFALLAAVVMAGSFAALTQGSQVFSGGTGTAEDPWQISSAQELLAVNEDLGASYVLTEDIDLSEYENFPMIGTYVMDENSPQGEDPVPEMAFTGTFDGAGHTISNLTIDCSEDMEHMFGVGLFSCVGKGGVVKNLVVQDISVKGMMLTGGVVGYAFYCTVDDVDLTATERNCVEATMVMSGGIIGGLTCSSCVNCDVENTDVVVAPGGNSGILGGGFSKPALENCTVKNSSLSGVLGEVPMFGMTEGAWIGGLTGCVNLDDFDPAEWYVKNCLVADSQITISGKGSLVGGLTGACGVDLEDSESPRMLVKDCLVENVEITVSDGLPCVGAFIGGGFSEGGTPRSFLIDGCEAKGVTITTDVEDLAESATGLLVGQSLNSQFMGLEGTAVDIVEGIDPETINSTADVTILKADGSQAEASLVGQVLSTE